LSTHARRHVHRCEPRIQNLSTRQDQRERRVEGDYYSAEVRAYNGRTSPVAAVIVTTELVVDRRTKCAQARQQYQYGVDGDEHVTTADVASAESWHEFRRRLSTTANVGQYESSPTAHGQQRCACVVLTQSLSSTTIQQRRRGAVARMSV